MTIVKGTNCGFVTTAPTADPGELDSAIDNYAFSVSDTSPSGSNKITEIGWFNRRATEEANFEVGLYDVDGDGDPGNLLEVSRTNAKGTGTGWATVQVDWTIDANTDYFIAVQLDNTDTDSATARPSSAIITRCYINGATTLENNVTWTGPYVNGGYAIYALTEEISVGFTRKIKIAGTFQDKPIKEKKAGTFEDKPISIKVGGTFQDA